MRYTIIQITIRILRKLYFKILKSKDGINSINDANIVSEKIVSHIISGQPLMISRFGAVEIESVANYLGVISPKRSAIDVITGKQREWWWNEGTRFCMKNNAGFFSNDDESLARFGELMLKDMKEIDILLSWQHLETLFQQQLSSSVKVGFIYIDPYWSDTPWTKVLEGKRVLVIHPFAEEIEYQYLHNRTKIHKNPNVLPLFELKTIRAVQSIGGSNEFATWFDALEYMEHQIDGVDFDICLLGCGAYGMPLAAYIKRQGKQAIHFGGSLQLLFGIKGKRWETTEYGKEYFDDKIGKYPSLMNEYWIRPYDASKFDGAEKVEGGCYW